MHVSAGQRFYVGYQRCDLFLVDLTRKGGHDRRVPGRQPLLRLEDCIADKPVIGDHGLAYLDYEGPVSGQRGSVRRREQGLFEWTIREADKLEARVDGIALKSRLQLVRVAGDSWRALFIA